MSKCSKSPSGYGEIAGQTIRPLDLYHSSCLSMSPPLPPLAGRQKQSPCSSGFIRLPGSAVSPGIRGADMVEGQFRCMEWEEPLIRITGSHNRKRCIPLGLGAFCMGVATGGQWSQGESQLHINCLELQAGAFAIRTFARSKAQMKVRQLMDNVSAAHYINRMGGTKSPGLARLAIDL